MKPLISKLVLILSIVFFIGVNTSCVVDQIDCADAQVEIVNNTNTYIYYSLDPADTWCYPDSWLNPGETLLVPYGELHASSEMPEFLQFFYRYDGPGAPDVAMDIEIDDCNKVVYLR